MFGLYKKRDLGKKKNSPIAALAGLGTAGGLLPCSIQG